jgi:arylsulfatase A-like enzyme
MLRQGKWKAVRQNLIKEPDAPIKLYNLEEDVEEKKNLADMYPEIIKELWTNMNKARIKSNEFPFPALDNQIFPRTLITKL